MRENIHTSQLTTTLLFGLNPAALLCFSHVVIVNMQTGTGNNLARVVASFSKMNADEIITKSIKKTHQIKIGQIRIDQTNKQKPTKSNRSNQKCSNQK